MAVCPKCDNDFDCEVPSSQFEKKFVCPILECSVIYYLPNRTTVSEAYPGRIEKDKQQILEKHNIEPKI